MPPYVCWPWKVELSSPCLILSLSGVCFTSDACMILGFRGSVYRALGLMVAASPCALAAAPLAYAIAISSCARKVFIIVTR